MSDGRPLPGVTGRKRLERDGKQKLERILPFLRQEWEVAVEDAEGLSQLALEQLYSQVLPRVVTELEKNIASNTQPTSSDDGAMLTMASSIAAIQNAFSPAPRAGGTARPTSGDDQGDHEDDPMEGSQAFSDQFTRGEVRLLAGLTDTNSDGLVHKGGFFQGIMLWMIVRQHRKEWEERIQTKTSKGVETVIEQLLQDEGADSDVEPQDDRHEQISTTVKHDASWVVELASKVTRSKKDWHFAILFALGYWVMHEEPHPTEGLIREKLRQRLRMEEQLQWGCLRFLTLLSLFVLSTTALERAGDGMASRGIRENLIHRLSLDKVASVSTVNDAYEYLKVLSTSAQKFAPLSASYFDDGAELRLLGELRTLTEPVTLPPRTKLWIGEAFTFQAWVGLSDVAVLPPAGLPLFRRSLKAVGAGSELSCLSWNFPPSLAYGAHDFGGTSASTHGNLQEYVPAKYPLDESSRSGAPKYKESEQMVLHSLVVNRTHARFYVGDRLLHVAPLRRIVTNCKAEITTLGARGLMLANVNYYARALSENEIKEVFKLGGLLGNLGYMVQPRTIHDLTVVEQLSLEGAINARIAQEETEVQTAKYKAVAALSTAAIMFQESSDSSGFLDPVITPTVGPDPALGKHSTQIVGARVVTDKDVGVGVLNESANAFPRFGAGKAITVSLWMKQDSLNSQGFIISRAIPNCPAPGQCDMTGMDLDNICWYLYSYPNRIDFTYPHETLGWTDPDTSTQFYWDNLSAAEQFRGEAFRHIVLVIDPARNESKLELYVDGRKAQFGFPPEQAVPDCEDSVWLERKWVNGSFDESLSHSEVWIGGRKPNNWLLTNTQMTSLRVFHEALSAEDILRLFEGDKVSESSDQTILQASGCLPAGDIRDDMSWLDEYGNSCLWYYDTRVKGLTNCKVHDGARRHCQVACNSVEACFRTSAPEVASMQIWQQQIEIRSKGSWGSMCIAKSTTAAREAITCGRNAVVDSVVGNGVDCSQYEHEPEALKDCLGDVTWTSKGSKGWQFLPCKAILEAEEPACAWDDTGLEEVANKSRLRGTWSMQMWYEVLDANGCVPGIRLIGGDGATFARVHPGKGEISEPLLDPPDGAGCREANGVHFFPYGPLEDGCTALSEKANLEPVADQRPGVRHLLIFGRTKGDLNFCNLTAGKVEWGIHLNAQGDVDCPNEAELPEIPASRDFLRIIGVMGNLRMSPITLTAGYPTVPYMADTLAAGIKHQQLRRGPDPIPQDQFATLKRKVQRFKEKTFLVAPPMLFQKRRTGRECEWDFSEMVVEEIVSAGQDVRCRGLYSCESFSKMSLYQCPGDVDQSDALWFGGAPRQVNGVKQYVELLQTITDFPVVVRPRSNGDDTAEVKKTSEFLDDLTHSAEVKCIFFSPRAKVSSVLTVSFRNDENEGLIPVFMISNYSALTGDRLLVFECLQALSLIAQVLLAVQVFADLRYYLRQRKRNESIDGYTLFVACLDLVVLFSTVAMSIQMILRMERSEERTEDIIAELVRQDWGSERSSDDKISDLLGSYGKLWDMVATREAVELGAMFQTLLIFLALIMSTHLHPRFAALTSTLMYTLSEMLHFLMVFGLVLVAFAFIGTWRFGQYRDDMSTFVKTLYTQIDAVLGPPGTLSLSDWHQGNAAQWDYVIYVFLLHSFNFFFLVNFFLAIIVGGYTKFTEGFMKTDIEYDILTDCLIVLKKLPYQWRHRWANPSRIANFVEELPSFFVSVQQLMDMGHGKELFKDKASAQAFNDFYRKLDPLINPISRKSEILHEVNRMDSGMHARFFHFEHKQSQDAIALKTRLQKLEDTQDSMKEMITGIHDKMHGKSNGHAT